jgi:hypothetical protein
MLFSSKAVAATLSRVSARYVTEALFFDSSSFDGKDRLNP